MIKNVFYIAALTLLLSCGKSPACSGDNENKGDVAATYEGYDCPDLMFSEHIDQQYVIRSEDDISSSGLDSCLITTVDFDSYTLLGYPLGASGCSQKFIRDVSIDDEAKTVHYLVTVKECGSCLPWVVSPNFVLIPKIPDDYDVTFESKHK